MSKLAYQKHRAVMHSDTKLPIFGNIDIYV
jgi:hypothetical protein